jgi:hypothetical protein
VFGDIADTSTSPGLAFLGASHASEEGVDHGSAAEFVRLAMREGANRRELCRRFGIHPDTAYKWLARWGQGEMSLADPSRRPHTTPQRTPPAIERQVLWLRDRHPAWGARKIKKWLGTRSRDGPCGLECTRFCAGMGRFILRQGRRTKRPPLREGSAEPCLSRHSAIISTRSRRCRIGSPRPRVTSCGSRIAAIASSWTGRASPSPCRSARARWLRRRLIHRK